MFHAFNIHSVTQVLQTDSAAIMYEPSRSKCVVYATAKHIHTASPLSPVGNAQTAT